MKLEGWNVDKSTRGKIVKIEKLKSCMGPEKVTKLKSYTSLKVEKFPS